MKMKKIISVSVACIMAIGLLAGCAGGGTTTSNTEQFQDSEETLTLKWLGYPRNAGASEGTLPETTLEERFNVEIEPLFYEENKYNDKKTMLMAGGEIPDLIYELDPMHVVNDVDQDFLVEVPYETIEEYAPTYYSYLNEYAPGAWIYSRVDDKNWGVPNYNHSHMQSYQVVYRGDWLEKLGLEIPKTMDEFHDVLYAFSNEDPDGNGKNDTYGYGAGENVQYQNYFNEIFGAYGVLPFDWQEAEDGSIVYGGLTDKCKEVLQLLATWYKEGIIHPDFAVGTPNGGFGQGVSGYMTAQAYYDNSNPSSVPNTLKENYGGKVAIGLLPEGPYGDHGRRAWGRPAHVTSFGNTEGHGVKVPRMLKMMEAMHTDVDLWKTLKIGKEGETYKTLPEDTTAAYNFEMIGDYVSDGARVNGFDTNMAGTGMFTPVIPNYDAYIGTRSEAWKAYANEYVDESYCLTDYFYKVDIVPSAADYLVDLRTKQMAIMSEIISGAKTIDAYAEFEAEWERAGGKIMTEEANALKGEVEKIYKEIGIN